MNSLLKTVTRQRRDCDLNPGPSANEKFHNPLLISFAMQNEINGT